MDHSILSTLDLVIIAVYLVAMVSIGLYFVRRIKGSEDYYVAGRSFGPFILMATVCATIIGGSGLMGRAGKAYSFGTMAITTALPYLIGMFIFSGISGRISRMGTRYDITSMPELFEKRFGKTAKIILACLVAFDKHKKDSAEAAAKYILIATFSSGVMLFGISFIYAATGSLYFDNVAEVITAKPLSIIGMVFFFSGLGFKISLVPFHFWTADTYQGAPTPVTGYLSVVSKGAATLTLAIILVKVFGSMVAWWQPLLWIVIMLTITVGNLMAIRQTELKRFMAFSSISQAGYIMLAVIGANPAASQTALTFYVLVYVVANMSVFSVISAVEHRAGAGTQMSAYNGLYQTNPKLAFIMTIALFSLAGIPPFAGMFSKFFVFMAGVDGQDGMPFWPYFVVFIALINTVVSLYYYLLIVKAMYIKKEDNPLPTFAHGRAINASLTICTIGIVLFGVCSCIYQWIANAAGM